MTQSWPVGTELLTQLPEHITQPPELSTQPPELITQILCANCAGFESLVLSFIF
jgi:hypothetical protein